jgi:PAS domain-containing protein
MTHSKELRQKAEALAREKEDRKPEDPAAFSPEEMRQAFHELEVHQIELEMQNEELVQTHAEVEALLSQYTDLYDFAPVGYFTLARDGAIHQVNLAGASLLGVERGTHFDPDVIDAFIGIKQEILSIVEQYKDSV